MKRKIINFTSMNYDLVKQYTSEKVTNKLPMGNERSVQLYHM